MFDSLTKSKFYTKCKSLTKMTKVRLDSSAKKKKAVAKYLRRDIAELLRNGLNSNAYGRAEGLIVEQNMVAAYKFMDEFCDCISTNLATLDKQMECPKECREAIQSLMYAAARFAEFPELRDLRSVFAQRYGDCLELFLNKEFGELLNPRPATKEMKLQLLVDVAQEFSIEWDPKLFDQKLSKPDNNPHGVANLSRRRSEAGAEPAAPVYVRARSDSTATRRASISTASPVASDDNNPSKFMPPPPYVRANPEALQQKPRSVRQRQQATKLDEEERKLNELLIQQSGKRTTAYERSVTHTTGTKPLSWRSRDGDQRHARSLSEVPSGHVHPNLPDYDSLADRIASIKGENW